MPHRTLPSFTHCQTAMGNYNESAKNQHHTLLPEPTTHTRNRQQRTPGSTQRKRPSQPTLWNFIRQQLHPGNSNDNNSLDTTRNPSDTQESEVPITLTNSTQNNSKHQHSAVQTQESVRETEMPKENNHPTTSTQSTEQPNSTVHQHPIIHDRTNNGWGDLHHYAHPQKHFRVVSKNVSTLNPGSLDMLAITTKLQAIQASVFCAQETNTAWTPTTLNALQNQCRKVYPQHKLAVSSSKEKSDGWFQPGGTSIIALDVWASQVIGWGQDELLGRWLYLEMVGQQGCWNPRWSLWQQRGWALRILAI